MRSRESLLVLGILWISLALLGSGTITPAGAEAAPAGPEGTTPTATPTATLVPPTPTPPPTRTPLPTLTPCLIQFTDVPPTHPFYPYIQCLACRGVVSGYADGTFRPAAEVTRGQLTKVIGLALSYNNPIPSTRQTFEDVPFTHPFWLWIERLAIREVINGYPCGGPGEPCQPQNRPYFRPGNSATRGQIAKIVRLAAGWANSIPSNQQTFEDVPGWGQHPFWEYIEQLYFHWGTTGYACGGPGEPCMPPQNRPYFRTNGLTTRGQITKMVAWPFFSGDCLFLAQPQP